jgi:hypothetical protein
MLPQKIAPTVNAFTGLPLSAPYIGGIMWISTHGADVMTLTQAIARDPPKTRRFRLLAPLLVLLGLALLALVPGLLIHVGDRPHDAPPQSINGFMTYQGR